MYIVYDVQVFGDVQKPERAGESLSPVAPSSLRFISGAEPSHDGHRQSSTSPREKPPQELFVLLPVNISDVSLQMSSRRVFEIALGGFP